VQLGRTVLHYAAELEHSTKAIFEGSRSFIELLVDYAYYMHNWLSPESAHKDVAQLLNYEDKVNGEGN
jgi:hypothetical protein